MHVLPVAHNVVRVPAPQVSVPSDLRGGAPSPPTAVVEPHAAVGDPFPIVASSEVQDAKVGSWVPSVDVPIRAATGEGKMLVNAGKILDEWPSLESQRIIHEVFDGINSKRSCQTTTSWTNQEVRRFALRVLAAHGLRGEPWSSSTFDEIYESCGQPETIAGAELLARRFLEHFYVCLKRQISNAIGALGGSVSVPCAPPESHPLQPVASATQPRRCRRASSSTTLSRPNLKTAPARRGASLSGLKPGGVLLPLPQPPQVAQEDSFSISRHSDSPSVVAASGAHGEATDGGCFTQKTACPLGAQKKKVAFRASPIILQESAEEATTEPITRASSNDSREEQESSVDCSGQKHVAFAAPSAPRASRPPLNPRHGVAKKRELESVVLQGNVSEECGILHFTTPAGCDVGLTYRCGTQRWLVVHSTTESVPIGCTVRDIDMNAVPSEFMELRLELPTWSPVLPEIDVQRMVALAEKNVRKTVASLLERKPQLQQLILLCGPPGTGRAVRAQMGLVPELRYEESVHLVHNDIVKVFSQELFRKVTEARVKALDDDHEKDAFLIESLHLANRFHDVSDRVLWKGAHSALPEALRLGVGVVVEATSAAIELLKPHLLSAARKGYSMTAVFAHAPREVIRDWSEEQFVKELVDKEMHGDRYFDGLLDHLGRQAEHGWPELKSLCQQAHEIPFEELLPICEPSQEGRADDGVAPTTPPRVTHGFLQWESPPSRQPVQLHNQSWLGYDAEMGADALSPFEGTLLSPIEKSTSLQASPTAWGANDIDQSRGHFLKGADDTESYLGEGVSDSERVVSPWCARTVGEVGGEKSSQVLTFYRRKCLELASHLHRRDTELVRLRRALKEARGTAGDASLFSIDSSESGSVIG